MRFLFLGYNFPGPLGPMAAWLGKNPDYRIVFAASRFRQEVSIPNVHRVLLKKYRASGRDDLIANWEDAVNCARNAAQSLETVKETGFAPDIVFNVSSNGIFLAARQVYPHAFMVNFPESSLSISAGQLLMRSQLQALQILGSNLNYSFSPQVLQNFPKSLAACIRLLPPLVDHEFFSRRKRENAVPAAPAEKLLLVFAADSPEFCLEFCKHLLKNPIPCKILLFAANSFLRRKLEAAEKIPGFSMLPPPRQGIMADFFANASLAVFLGSGNYLLEAMSAGCPAVFLAKQENQRENAFFPKNVFTVSGEDAASLAGQVLAILGNRQELENARQKAWQEIRENFAADTVMPALLGKIIRAHAKWKSGKG